VRVIGAGSRRRCKIPVPAMWDRSAQPSALSLRVGLSLYNAPLSSPSEPEIPIPLSAGQGADNGWQKSREACTVETSHSPYHNNGDAANTQADAMIRDIERMEQVVGKRMYRGLLKALARVWNPKEIKDPATRQKVLAHMQAAERGLR
jgi:hypothetical protein